MNSRQRIQEVLKHRIPDRVPIDFGATPGTSISPIAYDKLRKKLGINGNLIKIPNFLSQAVYPEQTILDIYNVDIIDAGRSFLKSIKWKNYMLLDGTECLIPDFIKIEIDINGNSNLLNEDGFIVARKRKDCLYFEECSWPFKSLKEIPVSIDDKAFKKIYWTIPFIPWHLDIFNSEQFKIFVTSIKELSENTDKAISLMVLCDLFESAKSLRGTENFLCDIYQDKKGAERLLNIILEKNLKKLEKLLDGVGRYVDILRFVDDLGFQNGPLISPEKYKEIFKPRHKKMWDYVHNKSKCAVSLHSCGSIFELLPDLIDAGVEIINPVQTSARDMNPEKLKKEFGNYLVFWGGCGDTQATLPFGNTKDVEKDTRKRIKILGQNGGLIFAHINTIQPDVPSDNVISMLQAANKYGVY